MHSSIAKPLREIINLLKLECHGFKLATKQQHDRFSEIFNITNYEYEIYINSSILFINDPDIYKLLEYNIDPESLIARLEVADYNYHIFLIRYLKEYMIKEALDLHDMPSERIEIEEID